jgi:hypothetical protein
MDFRENVFDRLLANKPKLDNPSLHFFDACCALFAYMALD